MPAAPDDRSRTWVPLAAAAAIGAVAVVGAIVAFALGGGPDEVESDAIGACEAEHERTGGAAIVSGSVHDPTGWRDAHALAAAEGEVAVPPGDLTPETVAAWDAAAEEFEASGTGIVTVVWRLDDDSFAQCTVPVSSGSVDATQARTGPLRHDAGAPGDGGRPRT